MRDKKTTRLMKALPVAVLCLASLPTASQAARVSNPVASFSGLDKITGRITTFDVYVGETVQFGALQVTPRACFNRDETEAQRVDGFVEVDEITLDRKIKRIFNGWMFAESPALNAIEHPIFDVWLKECKKTSDVPPPKNLKIPPNEDPNKPAPKAPQADAAAPSPQAPAAPPAAASSDEIPTDEAPAAEAPTEDAAPDANAEVPVAPPLEAPRVIEEPPIASPQDGQRVAPNDGFDAPLDQGSDVEDFPEADQPYDGQVYDPDSGFGLPPESVPDDGFGQPLPDEGAFPPPPRRQRNGVQGGGFQ